MQRKCSFSYRVRRTGVDVTRQFNYVVIPSENDSDQGGRKGQENLRAKESYDAECRFASMTGRRFENEPVRGCLMVTSRAAQCEIQPQSIHYQALQICMHHHVCITKIRILGGESRQCVSAIQAREYTILTRECGVEMFIILTFTPCSALDGF
jgi:hypothetical protein